ncbi:O-methyltransferase-domain-containing protein, partial [Suillus plorans]
LLPLSQHSSVEHPLDDPTTYLPSTALFDARRLSLELKNLIQSPLDKRMDEKYSAYGAASIDILIKTNTIDYLSDLSNPSEGIPVTELASKFELDSRRAGRRLNLCTPGFVSIVGAMPRWVTESDWKLSRSPAQTAFQVAFKTPLQRFSWVMQNPQALIPLADHLHMSVLGDMSTPSIVADYPWEQLETPIIVDCGGGEGGLVTAILDAYSSFQAIVQDMENVVALTSSIMKERRPRDIESGTLKAEAHDLFQSQPRIGNEYSFILRHILHGWADKEAVGSGDIGNVARALGPKSKILIIEMVAFPNVDSTATISAKSFLLDGDYKRPDYCVPSHFGSASKLVNAFSVHMPNLMNGCERSLREWESLVKGCGLCITNCALDSRVLL